MTTLWITHRPKRFLSPLIAVILLFMQPAHAGNYIAFIHTDVLGNPVAVTDQNGNIVSREHVTPFGDSLGKRSSDDTTPIGSSEHGIGYTGHIRDKDLGLTYMQARYYDPTIGRFMGTDPVGFTDNLDPAYFNRFSYVKNNPYIYTDPFGESDLDMLDSNRNTIGMDMACPVCSPAGSGPGPLDYGAFAADDILGGSGHSIEAGGELLSGLAILGTSGILDQRKSRKSIKRNPDATKGIKPDFIVSSKGTAMPTNKDFNLVDSKMQGDWFQIHNTHTDAKALGLSHTHYPKRHNQSTTREIKTTSGADIDRADSSLRSGQMRERLNRRDMGGLIP